MRPNRSLAAEELLGFFGAAGLLVLGGVLSATLESQFFCWGGLLLAVGTYVGAAIMKPRRFRARVQGTHATEVAQELGTSEAAVVSLLEALANALRTEPSRIALDRPLGDYADDVAFLVETDDFDDLREAFPDGQRSESGATMLSLHSRRGSS